MSIVENTPAAVKEKPKGILQQVQAQVDVACRKGLAFPPDFNLANAMASAKIALISLGVIDANSQPTGLCNLASVVNAIFDMCVQGLNVGKKQGYFINYGGVLTFQRSYFGDIALAERCIEGLQCYGDVILQGEKFVPKRMHTQRGLIMVIEAHEVAWPARDLTKITGAYFGAVVRDPKTGFVEDLGIELMTIDQIQTSWLKSKTYKGPSSKTFHNEQRDLACMRTVSRRWSKPIINASNDAMLREAVQRQELIAAAAEVDEEAEIKGNGQPLSLPQATEQIEMPQGQQVADPVGAGNVNTVTGEVTEQGQASTEEPF